MDMLLDMGFTASQGRKALAAAGGDVQVRAACPPPPFLLCACCARMPSASLAPRDAPSNATTPQAATNYIYENIERSEEWWTSGLGGGDGGAPVGAHELSSVFDEEGDVELDGMDDDEDGGEGDEGDSQEDEEEDDDNEDGGGDGSDSEDAKEGAHRPAVSGKRPAVGGKRPAAGGTRDRPSASAQRADSAASGSAAGGSVPPESSTGRSTDAEVPASAVAAVRTPSPAQPTAAASARRVRTVLAAQDSDAVDPRSRHRR